MSFQNFVYVFSSSVGSNQASLSVTHDQIILGLIGLVGTSIAALVYTIKNNNLGKAIAQDASAANKQSDAANKAVNNIGPGEHRLYDVIARMESKQDDFDKKWGNLPASIGDAVSLAETLTAVHQRIELLDHNLTDHINREDEQFDILHKAIDKS